MWSTSFLPPNYDLKLLPLLTHWYFKGFWSSTIGVGLPRYTDDNHGLLFTVRDVIEIFIQMAGL